MAKNIVVIGGSGRRKGNSELLADAFAKGATAAGHTVSRFEPAADRIQGCIGCDACWSKGKPCVFDDGFDRLAPLLEKADVIVLSGPVYWYTFSTLLKSAIDKLYAYYGTIAMEKAKTKPAISECVLLMTAEDTDEGAFQPSVDSYHKIAGLNGWKDRGCVLVHGVGKKGDILGNDGLAQAEKLGREL